jgi:uncharacterized protein (TIGR00369 family)
MDFSKPVDVAALRAEGWDSRYGDGFNAQLGDIWFSPDKTHPAIGFFVEAAHTNLFGMLHGGALLTFADISLGYGASASVGHKPMVTAQLQAQFVASARAGDFVYAKPEVIRGTRHLIFVRELICVGDTTVANADGIWKLLEPRKEF